jgi:hypothetical protein
MVRAGELLAGELVDPQSEPLARRRLLTKTIVERCSRTSSRIAG